MRKMKKKNKYFPQKFSSLEKHPDEWVCKQDYHHAI